MCGIAFVWHADPAVDVGAVARRMAAAQAHRGPDHLGVLTEGPVAMSLRRLRVLDVHSRSDQPFRVGGRREVLVYNGEIYNWREVRDALAREGVPFVTEGDTEVLHRALCHWGVEALDRLHGMFAFAFWRPLEGDVLLARDRMGIKPLHVAIDARRVLVASELKGIAASGLLEVALDPEAIHQVFRFNHTLGDRTSLRGVRALEPGTWIRVDLTSLEVTVKRWWQVRFRPPTPSRFEDRAAELDARFRRAIASHVAVDGPVACWLSGGLDSTGIASEASRLLGDRLTAWSMVFPGTSADEEPEIDRVARDLGLRVRKVAIDSVGLAEYRDFVLSAEMPQWWTSDLALRRLAAAAAAEGHRVVLSGEGPDELLAGYDAFRAMTIRRWLERVGLVGVVDVAARVAPLLKRALPWADLDLAAVRLYFARHAPARRAADRAAYGFHPESAPMWEMLPDDALAPSMRALAPGYWRRIEATIREEVASAAGADELEKNLAFEIAVRLPRWVLHMGDRMSAAQGLELRFPYLDDDVVDATLALPVGDRLRGLDEKHILKRVHAKRLPRHVLARHKKALFTPILPWLRGILEDDALADEWAPERFEAVGLLDHAACEAARRRLQGGRFDSGLDRMRAEWTFTMALSTHLLDRGLRALATAPSSPA